MKKLLLFCITLFVVMSVHADVVTFDFSTAEGLMAMGVDSLPTTSKNGYNLEGRTLRLGGIEIITSDSGSTPNRIWANSTTSASTPAYELRTYAKNALIINTAKGGAILGLEIESRTFSGFNELSTKTQLYDTVSSITLTSIRTNYIQKITLVTIGEGSADSIPTTNPDTISNTGDTLSISVASALEIGSLLSANETTPRIYEITGYISNMETTSENYATWGDQSFWITDTKGSTANTNALGALHVYQGVTATEAKVGDKVKVISAIKNYANNNSIETVAKSPVTILETNSDTIPVVNPDTVVHTGVVTFDFSTAEGLMAMGVDSLPTTDKNGYNLEGRTLRLGGVEITGRSSASYPDRIWANSTTSASTPAYELRTYSGNTLLINTAKGCSILALEVQSGSLYFAELSSNTQLYDTVSSITLTSTNKNRIQKITLVTIGVGSSDTVPVINPDTVPVVIPDTLPNTDTDTLSINVATALEIGSLLSSNETTPQIYEITGYISNMETTSENYATWGDQSFWITDTKGSTANTNALGALHVYKGETATEAKLGDKVKVISAIKNYGSKNIIETVANSPVTILETASDTVPDYDAETQRNVLVKLFAPKNSPCDIEIAGSFKEDGWSQGILMSFKNGVYTAHINTTEAARFKFRAEGSWNNEICYSNGAALENLICGDFMNEEKTQMIVDLSDESRYMWTKPSSCEQIDYYSITAKADDSKNGSVSGSGDYALNETAVLLATPLTDCEFVQWSDGSKLNPRSIRVLEDAIYIAEFRRHVPLPPVEKSDIMYFTSADTVITATRVYNPSEITAYDKLIIATVDNKNMLGSQCEAGNIYRKSVGYTPYMALSDVSMVEVFPHGNCFRLKVEDGYLAPRCTNCGSKPNQLFAEEEGGADWQFVQYGYSVVPQAVSYAQRMILYNKLAPRFSSYRQVTGLDRLQTTVFKLSTPHIIPQDSVQFAADSIATNEEKDIIEDIPTQIEPKDTAVVITTPYVEFVYSFTLIIWADKTHTKALVIITYDAQGNQLSVTRPNAVRRLAADNEGDVSFEVGELEPATTYDYTLTACEDDGSILTTVNNAFATRANVPQTVTIVNGENTMNVIKIVRNGQILIIRGNKAYTITGQEVQ